MLPALADIAKKIDHGERLSNADALTLYQEADLASLGALADQVNLRQNQNQVFFNVNRHINPTNICALSCKFCAYSRKPGEEGAYAYTVEEMVVKAGEAVAAGATEVHMVGGLHPRWKLDHYLDMIKAIKQAYPDLHLKAFTAVELDWMARRARLTIRQLLETLVEAGLGSMPGGGAEIFHPEIRDQICDTKVSAEQWLDTHRTAHELGLHSNATMLYGHIENYSHRVDHMARLRGLQDETKGFNAFIPLSFQPFQNDLGVGRYTYGYDDLKTIAIARLFLDNFRHVKAYWIMLGQDIAQLGLRFGANDLDGTVIEEKISRMAGGRAGMVMGRKQIEQLIAKSGSTPIERDTLYRPLSTPASVTAAEATRQDSDDAELQRWLDLAQNQNLHALGAEAAALRHDRHQEDVATLDLAIVPSWQPEQSPGQLCQDIEDQLTAAQQEHNGPATSVHLDVTPLLDQDQGIDLTSLLNTLTAIGQRFPDLAIALRGSKALWALARNEQVPVDDLMRNLRECGVGAVLAADDETETDLTHSEVEQLYRELARRDISAIATVELAAPSRGGQPMWRPFIERIQTLVRLHRETGALTALQVRAAPGSPITPVEYLRAVALTRLIATDVDHIIAPLENLPVLSPARGLGTKHQQHPAEKYAAICLHYGASDLGSLNISKIAAREVLLEMRAAGFDPRVRDSRWDGQDHGSLPALSGPDARHLPPLAQMSQ